MLSKLLPIAIVLLGLSVVGGAGWWLYHQIESRASTAVTDSSREGASGDHTSAEVDYVANLNCLGSDGVSAEQNAVVPLVRLLGTIASRPEVHAQLERLLGVQGLPQTPSTILSRAGQSAAGQPSALGSELNKLLEPMEAEVRRDIDLAILRSALELYSRKLSEGRYPGTVEELRAAVDWPSDQFTDQPVQITISSPSIRVYSLGMNRTDDGGPFGTRDDTGVLLRE